LVCNNHHKETLPGEDYQAFERDLPGENKAGYSEGQAVSKLPLETCETMNKTWGYNLTDDKFKTETELLHYLINAAGHGANLLLNVGPMPNGEIQPECVALLKKMGDWTKQYGYTIFGAKPGVVKPNEWGATTQNDKTHYIHIYDKEKISLSIAFTHNVKSVKAINSDGQVTWKADKKNKTLNLDLTQITFDPIDTIIEIVVK
jgi:alpha-L-fucosidase